MDFEQKRLIVENCYFMLKIVLYRHEAFSSRNEKPKTLFNSISYAVLNVLRDYITRVSYNLKWSRLFINENFDTNDYTNGVA